MRTHRIRHAVTAAAALALATSAAAEETLKIGFISSYCGLNADQGEYMERRMRLLSPVSPAT
jgi:hypothetical protein